MWSHPLHTNIAGGKERDWDLLMLQGCKATICMPVTTPDIKVEAVRRMGGLVELVGESYTETQAIAQVSLNSVQASCYHELPDAVPFH